MSDKKEKVIIKKGIYKGDIATVYMHAERNTIAVEIASRHPTALYLYLTDEVMSLEEFEKLPELEKLLF